jgi:hypothetical protein
MMSVKSENETKTYRKKLGWSYIRKPSAEKKFAHSVFSSWLESFGGKKKRSFADPIPAKDFEKPPHGKPRTQKNADVFKNSDRSYLLSFQKIILETRLRPSQNL